VDVIEHIENNNPTYCWKQQCVRFVLYTSHPNLYFQWNFFPAWSIIERTTGRKRDRRQYIDAEKRKK
jgi:hypothetical protein